MLFYDADADAYDASKTPQFGENLLYEYYCSLRDEPEKIPDMGSQKLFSWMKNFLNIAGIEGAISILGFIRAFVVQVK